VRLTEYRTMLYLPQHLYQQSVLAARRRKESLAAFIREALYRHLKQPEKGDYHEALAAGFGLWRGRFGDGRRYERKLRSGWAKR
jgi:hypothetical protein